MTCKQYTYNVDSGESQVLIGLSSYDFTAQKYVLTVEDTVSERALATELFVSWTGDAAVPTPSFVRYATVGAEIDYGFDIAYNSLTQLMEITVTNNESGSLRFDLSEHGTVS